MSKKHFEAAAEEIRNMNTTVAAMRKGGLFEQANDMEKRAQGAEDVWVSIASQFNDRFDTVRFRQACRA